MGSTRPRFHAMSCMTLGSREPIGLAAIEGVAVRARGAHQPEAAECRDEMACRETKRRQRNVAPDSRTQAPVPQASSLTAASAYVQPWELAIGHRNGVRRYRHHIELRRIETCQPDVNRTAVTVLARIHTEVLRP